MCPPSKEKENSFVIVSDYGVALRSWSQSLIIDFHCIWWLQKEPFCGLQDKLQCDRLFLVGTGTDPGGVHFFCRKEMHT